MYSAARLLVLCSFFFAAGMLYSTIEQPAIGRPEVETAQILAGLQFSDSEIDSMLPDLLDLRRDYLAVRNQALPNAVMPALQFNPLPRGFALPTGTSGMHLAPLAQQKRPKKLEDLAFASIRELAGLIRSRAVSSEELTGMFLQRLKTYDPQLHCVITLMEDQALEQARRADREIASGTYRGLLHGIPYGAKDLLATRSTKTTWGAMPYRDQQFTQDATVIRKLEEAGAVLVAKLSLGALAWGDVWYGGKTRNPWNTEQGSSGSSAGSASATSAGLVPFAIGSETWGSIVSPATRCGISGLRPTYGRVSRSGAMALSWSMDKIGPLCRSVEDCAIVFNAILGPDAEDPTLYDTPFNYPPRKPVSSLRIGYLPKAFEGDTTNRRWNDAALAALRTMGYQLVPLTLPDLPVGNLGFILSAEAAAAFDELTRSNRDDEMVRQIRNAWPNVFRQSRFIPAVEYINANRIRTMVIQEMQQKMQEVDVYIAPSFSDNLLLTNLTGHPCVVVQNGFNDNGDPVSISFTGRLFDEENLLGVAQAWQEATGYHLKHPAIGDSR